MKKATTEKALKLGIFGAVLTLIGDLLIGCVQFPEGAGLLDGYLGAALVLPVWRPVLGGLIGCLGICLEVPAMLTVYPLTNAINWIMFAPKKNTINTADTGSKKYSRYSSAISYAIPCPALSLTV